MPSALTALLGAILKALITPLLLIWAGMNHAKAKSAQAGVDDGKAATKRREELRGLNDKDLDTRLRDSQE
jgi:5-bromo-4-chloroindolyl phosphate hydrolysis protein